MPLYLCPVAVQGDGAAEQIAFALSVMDRLDAVDVILVGRGGGSIEDLWPFNEETVARAIAACHKPVVSAVGHETDFTIADFWGIKDVLPDLYDGHGISVVLLHTQHAKALFDEINKFDDATWIKEYGSTGKHVKQVMEELNIDDIRDLVRGYWTLMHDLLQEV